MGEISSTSFRLRPQEVMKLPRNWSLRAKPTPTYFQPHLNIARCLNWAEISESAPKKVNVSHKNKLFLKNPANSMNEKYLN